MSWTAPDDVTGSWIGENPPEDDALIQRWIDKAEREIRFRVPTLQARLDEEQEGGTEDTPLLSTAVDVTVAMVTRVFRNPEGIRQVNETTGPYTESRTYGGNTPGGLGLTGDELAKLQGVTGGRNAFTIDMIPATSPFSPSYQAPVW